MSAVTELGLNCFRGSSCICEGFRWRGALFCLGTLLWRLRRPTGSGKQGESQIHFFHEPWKGSHWLSVRESSGLRKKVEGKVLNRASKDR